MYPLLPLLLSFPGVGLSALCFSHGTQCTPSPAAGLLEVGPGRNSLSEPALDGRCLFMVGQLGGQGKPESLPPHASASHVPPPPPPSSDPEQMEEYKDLLIPEFMSTGQPQDPSTEVT